MVMEPLDPASGARPETRRPLLMDPAGARPSGFAPPSVLGHPATGQPPAAGAASAAGAPASSITAVGTPSVLAGTAVSPAAGSAVPGEASFGPVSQVIRVSVRTLSSRIDLVLPDRSTIAETLETVLELAPRSLREQAIAHGGWILRTAAGEPIPGSVTLLDQGIVDGATLFLTGIDAADSAAVYDDVADAVADTVLADPSAWPASGGRTVALGAAGLFAAITCLSLLWAGPPWTAVAVTLGVITLLAQVAAGLLSRGVGDAGIATVAGLLSVASGVAAATVAAAGSATLLDIGPAQLLLGAAAGTVLATTAALLIGTRRVPFVAIITGSLLLCVSLACCVVFDLSPAGGAAIVAGLALGVTPLVPSAALALARFELNPLPSTPDEVYADHETVDAPAVRQRTRQAVGYVTALIQGLSWPTLVACVILAFSQDVTGQVLAGIVGAGLILRARLFVTIGQRLPLLLAGIGAVAALLVALMSQFDGQTVLFAVALPGLIAVVSCLLLAARRRRASPAMTRAAEITELLIAIASVPLVAGVLGLFGFIRGLGG
jgi:type VII secretion integral membrane protein EccD